MTATTDAATTSGDATSDVTDAVTAWLAEHWDPDLTVAEWWDRLGRSGWAMPTWPVEWYGKGLSRAEGVRVQQAMAAFGALGAPGGLGTLLAGPTITVHGTDEQRERYLLDIVTGRLAWCQLFSEPGAGSDLAGLNTRAELDGDEWVVNGQKVWTSGGHWADLGMLLARTDPDVPKHQGITYFALDMHQPGVEIRPLRELTGRAMFNEVFLTDVRVPNDAAIGGINNGWAVANTTLMFERSGLGAGGGSAGLSALPGTVAGDVGKRVGEFVRGHDRIEGGVGPGASMTGLTALARENGTIADADVRQELARLYSMNEIARYTNLRQRALARSGGEIAGLGNIAKLSMSRILRLTRDLSGRILGPYATLHGYNTDDAAALVAATGGAAQAGITESMLFAQAPQIYGGTDEIQHNIIGERVLGLPKEPSADKGKPFRELPKNG
jgi:alkylation response protein AidB-like acyl-CoA dehydrogenase